MMCRLLQSIPRGLRHKAQANATHPPWTGNGSQQSRRQEENVRNELVSAPLSSDASQASDKRSAQPLQHSRSLLGLTHWKWEDGWRSFTGNGQWDSFKKRGSSYTSHDALEWGTALVFSLHLCRVLTASTLPEDSSGGKKQILASVADRLPGLWRKHVSPLSLLSHDEGKKTKPKQDENHHKPDIPESTPATPLTAAVAQLQAVTNQSLGQAYNSLGVKKAQSGRLEEAVSHFAEGCKVGFSKATFNLAVCYEQGKGVAQDLEKAADLYKKATAQGHPLANFNLGVFHMTGKGGLPQDTSLALELIGSAAAAGVTQANRYLGIHFLENKDNRDEEKAATCLQKAVEKQDTDAQYYLGLCYEHGWGVATNGAKAVSLYHKAALKDHPEALYSLAKCHELGIGGLPVNRESALQFNEQASNLGHLRASESMEQLLCNPTSDTTKAPQIAIHTGATETSTRDHDSSKILQAHGSVENNNKSLHVSISAPSLGHNEGKAVQAPRKDSMGQQFSYRNSKVSLSHLNLLLPYYFSLPSIPSLAGAVTNAGQSSKVSFQVGDDENAEEEDKADSAAYGFVDNRFHAATPWLTVT
ncbi:DAP3-binding cell death enhancer 1-like [Patiria miniata]|uniref:Death ligand signal enhancer n=1 Tax=Patiria miniata TaxID=46514 RepID=A0A913ZUH3_PATMI|nr:DAP3-binding cell death enhancer 1-like [Patiria miniata]